MTQQRKQGACRGRSDDTERDVGSLIRWVCPDQEISRSMRDCLMPGTPHRRVFRRWQMAATRNDCHRTEVDAALDFAGMVLDGPKSMKRTQSPTTTTVPSRDQVVSSPR